MQMSDRPSIDVERRRKADKPTERAEAPVRRRPGGSQGGPVQPSGGGGGSVRPSGGGGFPIPTKGKMGGCGGILLVIVIIAFYVLSGGEGGDLETPGPVLEQP